MADEQITIYLNRHKFYALKDILAAGGKDIQNEIQAWLDQLYEQAVPPDQSAEIDDIIAKENTERQREVEESRRYIAMRVMENGSESFIESPVIYDFPQAAMAARRYLKDEKYYDASSIRDVFYSDGINGSKIITPEVFEKYIEAGTGRNLLAAYDINLDGQTFSVLDKNKEWVSYSLQDVTTAAYHAFRSQYRPAREIQKIFSDRLEGKAIILEQESGQAQGMSM